jgi:hemolysin activation/secretion protein
MEGIAETISLYGHRSLYHLTRSGLTFTYGYNYRRLTDEMMNGNFKTEKHSHSVYAGLEGFERRKGAILNYQGKITVGTLGLDNDRARLLYESKKGSYTKGEVNVTAVQRLGNSTDVLMKLSGQIASHNLDGSERMYLGGANGVRAYPQGEGSGDEGIMATIEPRFYTKIPGLVFSTYFDIGHVKYNHDGSLDGRKTPSSGMTLKGYGFGLSYTKPNDWFARLDYARRIGGDPNLSEKAKANGRVWFMLGKIW